MFDDIIEFFKDIWNKIKHCINKMIDNICSYFFGKRITYLAFHHKNYLVRKKNTKRITRYINKYYYN